MPIFLMDNILIACSSFIIVLYILKIWWRGRDFLYSWILILFAICIFLAGINRITDLYRHDFRVLHDIINSLICLFVLITTIGVIIVNDKFKVLTLPRYEKLVKDLLKEIDLRQEANDKLKILNKELTNRISELENIKNSGAWFQEQEKILNDLKSMLKVNDV